MDRAKGASDEQLNQTRAECKKYQEELVTIKHTLAERDWEKENLAHEVTSCKNTANVLQKEKEELEKEFASLQQEMASMSTAVIQRSTLEDNEQLLAADKYCSTRSLVNITSTLKYNL